MSFPVRQMRSILRSSLAIIAIAFLVAGCGGGGTEPGSPGRISITPANPPPIPAGGTLQLSATVLDTKGHPMSGQIVTFSTNAPNIAAVSGPGTVSSVGPIGNAIITASVGTVQATASVTVVAGPAAAILRTSPDPGTVPAGATVGDSVRFMVKDAFGNPRGQETVTFAVAAGGGQASPATAQTDALGRVATMFRTGTDAGTNTLSAAVGGLTPASFSLTTAAPGDVAVSSVTPSPMTPGTSVTINGTGFDLASIGDAVSIDGEVATVTSATATQLVITLPATLPCTPSHQANILVTANGGTAIAHQTLRVGTPRNLAVGSVLLLSSLADMNCVELSPANAHYAVNVLNSSSIPTGITPFRFVGATSIPPGTTFAPRVVTMRQPLAAPPVSRDISSIEKSQSARSAMHIQMIEFNRRILSQTKNLFRHRPPRSTSSALRASIVAAVPNVGDMRAFRVFKPSTALGASGSCNDFVEINARVAYVGTRAVIYEDVAAPLAGQMDSTFTQLGQEFDNSMYPSDANNFGDPLITDPDTDADQHLNMVFTPVLPSQLAGFVLSCDFRPRSANNEVSNFGENFYARVPKVAGSVADNTDNPVRFLRTMRGVIVHEVKHIASFGARLENPAATSFEESWLEEGMAMVAEEVWARDRIYPGGTWKGNMIYQNTLFCEVRPTNPACMGRPFVVFDNYSRLYSFLDSPGATSLFGRVADNDFVFYGASWSFIRYNVDRYAASEQTYLRGITSAVSIGIANIAQQSGADPDQILENWSLALYLDGNPSMSSNADINISSWDTRDIFLGMHNDFSQATFPKTHPLVPLALSSGDFAIDNAGIHGGSFAPYDLTGVTADVRTIGLSPGFGTAGTLLRLVVARIQ